MAKFRVLFISLFCGQFSLTSSVLADQFHYNNVIIGDRALGLGGAYAGISDDASGVVYNPAGLAFALSNDVSGSANAFYTRKVTYKGVVENNDFTEHSSGMMAPFLGGLQKLDHMIPGVVMAFGLYSTDTELKDQNDKITTPTIPRFHRTANVRASTTYFSLAVAKRLKPNLSFGVGLSYMLIDELTQEYQDVQSLARVSETDPYFRILTQNVRQRLNAAAIEPMLGVQWAPINRLSIGFSVRKPLSISQKLENDSETTVAFVKQDLTVVSAAEDTGNFGGGKVVRDVRDNEIEDPLGEFPLTARLGLAWYASTRLVLAADVMYVTGAEGKAAQYDREPVINIATGAEYYITPVVPVRVGLFTNHDARPEPEAGKKDQRDHINYTGMSLFFAWVQPSNQISLGTVYQLGTGKAQKVGNSVAIHEVEAHALTLALSVTHSF